MCVCFFQEAVSFYLFAPKPRSEEVMTARLLHAYVRKLGRYFRAVTADFKQEVASVRRELMQLSVTELLQLAVSGLKLIARSCCFSLRLAHLLRLSPVAVR